MQAILTYFSQQRTAAATVFQKTLPLLLLGALIGVIALLLWSSNKSFGLMDEGFALLSAQSPGNIALSPTFVHEYLGVIFHLTQQNIILFRLANLLLTISTIPLLYWGAKKLLASLNIISDKKNQADSILIFSFIGLGILTQFQWLFILPTYNSLNAFAVNICCGLLFWLLGSLLNQPTAKPIFFWNTFAIGLCLGFSFFIKFPTAISLYLLIILTLLAFPHVSFRLNIKFIAVITLGIIAWSGLHFLLFQSPVIWWKIFHNGINMAVELHDGHDLGALTKYFFDFLKLSKAAFLNFWLVYAIYLPASLYLFLYKKNIKNLYLILISVIFAITLFQSFKNNLLAGGLWWTPNSASFYLGWTFILIMIFFTTLVHLKFGHKSSQNSLSIKQLNSEIIICLLFFCLPFTGAIGTSNWIYLNILITLAPWFVLIIFLLGKIANLIHDTKILRLGIFLIGLCSFVQITSGILLRPYNVYTKLTEQNTSCSIGEPATQLKLDAPLCKFITQFRQIAQTCGYQPGNAILEFYQLPGLVFALGGTSPITPWYSNDLIQTRTFIQTANTNSTFKKAFIVISSKDINLPRDLAKLGINLKEYQSCGVAHVPADFPLPFGNTAAELFKPKSSI